MTLLVGILCRDGIVIASDSVATFGTGTYSTIGQQEVQKVCKLNEHILYCGTGAIGISQLISDCVRLLWDKKVFSGNISPDDAMNKVGKAIAELVHPYLQTGQVQRSLTGGASSCLCKSLIALPINKKPYLFQFDFSGAPERSTTDLPFVSLGAGQPIADPFLALLRRLLWQKQEPSLSEGRLAAVWTIDHVARTNPGGVGGGIQIATLQASHGSMPNVTMLSSEDVEEHLERVASAEQALVNELRGKVSGSIGPLPHPPDGRTT